MRYPLLKILSSVSLLSIKAGRPWDELGGWDLALVLWFAVYLLTGYFDLMVFLYRRIGKDELRG